VRGSGGAGERGREADALLSGVPEAEWWRRGAAVNIRLEKRYKFSGRA
jgi:hypothetical protein